MRRPVVHFATVALAILGSVGCQSGPRWAFWKKENPAAVDSSAIARTAPTLPSAQATPTAVTGTGLQPATSPSSANLASATAATTAPPANSIYPITGAPPVTSAAALSAAPASVAVPGAVTFPATAATTPTVSPAGPYDPNAYRPPVSAASASMSQPASADRYATSAPASATTTPTSTTPIPSQSEFPQVAAAPQYMYDSQPAATATPSVAPSTADDRYGILPVAGPTAMPGAPANTGAAPAATQVAAPAGGYRPGGTSDYMPMTAGSHVEIATRPSPTPSAPATLPATSAYPQTPYNGSQSY